MMTEFFAGGFVLGKAENLQGRSRPGNVVVVVWAFNRPEGAFRSLRALRDLSGLHSSAERVRARRRAALAARHGRQRPGLGARARARARDVGHRAGRRADGCARASGWRARSTPRSAPSRSSAAHAVAPAKRPDLSTFAGRLGSLRIAENDLPGRARHRVVDGARAARRRRPAARRPAAAAPRPPLSALGLRGGATQVISVAQIHGKYVTYAWAFPSANAARAALRAAASQRGVRAAPRGRGARCDARGAARPAACATTSSGCAASCCCRSAPTGRRASRCCSRGRSSWRASSTRTRPRLG